MSNQFYETFKLLKDSTNYTKPLSYDEWLYVPDSLKVGVLYVQFYEQISLAWYKLKTKAAIEEDCVSEVLAYLSKNVYGIGLQQLHSKNLKKAKSIYKDRIFEENVRRAKRLHWRDIREANIDKAISLHSNDIIIHYLTTGRIMISDESLLKLLKPNEYITDKQMVSYLSPQEKVSDDEILRWLKEDKQEENLTFDVHTSKINEKTFKPSYIYRVVSNCLYCKSIDPYNGQTASTSWYNNVTSNVVMKDNSELDLFDTIPGADSDEVADATIVGTGIDKFWKLIENEDEDTISVINHILNGDTLDSDVKNRQEDIISELRDKISAAFSISELKTLIG